MLKILVAEDDPSTSRLLCTILRINGYDPVPARDGMEAGEHRIFDLVDRAWDLLNDPSAPQNGYCAFVYEKCAPTFSYYGYFAAAEELNERAKQLYERT